MAPPAQSSDPEPPGWFAGDLHVHCDCGIAGGLTVTPEQVFAAINTNRLAVVSLLADMGNGEVRDAARDLPKIRADLPLSTPLHSALGCRMALIAQRAFEQKAIGGHLILLGLQHGKRSFRNTLIP